MDAGMIGRTATTTTYISSALILLLLVLGPVSVSGHENHGHEHGHGDDADTFRGQHLLHEGEHALQGEKHIDTHDQDQAQEHIGKSLDHKGKDKSNTNTQAQLTTTLKAKDQHSDSYSHLHDNAHETEAMADNDHTRGDDTMVGLEHDAFQELGHPGPHGDLDHEDHDHDGVLPMHIYPSEEEWDEVDHGHYSHLIHDDGHHHGHHDGPIGHEFGHGGRLDGDMYTGPDYDMFGGNHHLMHGGALDHHHGHHGADLRHDPMPWIAADHL